MRNFKHVFAGKSRGSQLWKTFLIYNWMFAHFVWTALPPIQSELSWCTQKRTHSCTPHKIWGIYNLQCIHNSMHFTWIEFPIAARWWWRSTKGKWVNMWSICGKEMHIPLPLFVFKTIQFVYLQSSFWPQTNLVWT